MALTAAVLFGVLVVPASAQLHRVGVTLVTGEALTVTVDVPPGATVDSIEIPGLPAPVESVVDLGPVGATSPAPNVTTGPERTPAPATTPSGENRAGGDGALGSGSKGRGGGSTAPPGDDQALQPNSEALSGALEEPAAPADEPAKTPDATDRPASRNSDGTPTPDNPTLSIATPGPAAIGVPNFFIEKFRIPPFLLPIYQAAGIEYGVRWEVLAAINEIETDYGRNLNVSSAGAVGWMQFMPASWETYGVDGNQDGIKDPYSPVDAIFAAARYLRAAGADTDLRQAIFAYNHADWYVDSVVLRARFIGGLPADLVGSLSGLTQGRFPVQAKATYAQEVTRGDVKTAEEGENPAYVVESDGRRDGIRIFAKRGAPVVAANDGRIAKVGRNRRLGRFVVLQDVYGNTYTYARLGSVVESYPTPKPRDAGDAAIRRELALPPRDAAPAGPASVTTRTESRARRTTRTRKPVATRRDPAVAAGEKRVAKERLFAHPDRPNSAAAGGNQQQMILSESFGAYLDRLYGLDRSEIDMKPLVRGARVTAGTVLGRVGRASAHTAAHLRFEIRPAGRGAPRIDPKPILDGWKLLESTAIYRAVGRSPFAGDDAEAPSVGQILLMSKEALTQRVLADPNIELYECGRQDIRSGQIDRRVLATLEFLAASGLRPTVTSLRCGHSYLTASGNVSEHTTGTAVDIAAINGVTISPETQGAGSVTELTIQRLLTLQGAMKPHQIISLMKFDGTDNTFAMADHGDHIHVGFRPLYGPDDGTLQPDSVLEPKQWIKLIDRLDAIDNPSVAPKPSRYALKTTKSATSAPKGE
jgi:hypothetical protein